VGLEKYRKKRDFAKTPEPSGRGRKTTGRSFVIQKHAARRLHYDFRLELGGVLKSWAVPKGPSLDPAEKHLAVHVEDHPVEYGAFEGVIPAGEYGGGTVLVWDHGTWTPKDDDPEGAYQRGRLSFELHGERMKGSWSLVRMGGRRSSENENWLLLKSRDEAAATGPDAKLTEKYVDSVISGRDLEAIAREKDRTWHSNRAAKGSKKTRFAKAATPAPPELPGAKRAAMPELVTPQLATLASEPPKGEGWIYEIKYDGYRALSFTADKRVRFLSRSGKDWTEGLSALVRSIEALPMKSAILDGEIVVPDEEGKTSFQRLQNAMGAGRDDLLVYYVFDLLYLDGKDLRAVPLEARKRALKGLLSRLPKSSPLRYSEHVEGEGANVFAQACRLGVEGVVAKRRAGIYRGRRTMEWLKIKCAARQELVIGGYTDPEGTRPGIGALLLGVYDGGELRYAGKVGTGFTAASLEELAQKLKPLEQATSPFVKKPPGRRGIHWVKPKLVAEVSFAEWTDDGRLRHPAFHGLRADRDPREVVRERPAAPTSSPSPTRRSPRIPGKAGSPISVGGVRLTNPERVLFPELALTKQMLAEYYLGASDRMLPYLVDRPLMLLRCPEGHQSECWFQKHASRGMPEAVHTADVGEASGENSPHLYIDSKEGLISLVQMGALEIHIWGGRIDRLEQPDRLILDLDPAPDVEWRRVVETARYLRARLSRLGLESFVKTTGGKGLHVVVPLVRKAGWEEVEGLARTLAVELERSDPEHFISRMTKAKRGGKIFIDYLRNGRGATSIAPYSTRARLNAPVSVPITWQELERLESAVAFDLVRTRDRLERMKRDPWEHFFDVRQAISAKVLRAAG
jgi:bifunctional non-homologous end joining protein LigD